MTTTTSYSGYNAAAASVPDEAILGNLIWFSIREVDVDMATCRQHIADLNLSDTTLRDSIRPIDAFKKAVNDIEKKFPMRDNGQQSTFLVRSVGQDSQMSYRHVILERALVKQGRKRRLVYDPVAELVFNRGEKKNGTYSGYSIDITRKSIEGIELTEQEKQWLDIQLTSLRNRFQHYLTHLDSHAVRDYVREYLYQLGGVCVKPSGGVYFVQQAHKDELERLETFTERVGSYFHMLPLLDLGKQREMVLEAFEDEAVGEVDRMSQQIADILKDPDRSVRQKTFDRYAQQAAELLTKSQDYSDLLDRKTDRVSLQVQMFKQQLLQLTSRVSG